MMICLREFGRRVTERKYLRVGTELSTTSTRMVLDGINIGRNSKGSPGNLPCSWFKWLRKWANTVHSCLSHSLRGLTDVFRIWSATNPWLLVLRWEWNVNKHWLRLFYVRTIWKVKISYVRVRVEKKKALLFYSACVQRILWTEWIMYVNNYESWKFIGTQSLLSCDYEVTVNCGQ